MCPKKRGKRRENRASRKGKEYGALIIENAPTS